MAESNTQTGPTHESSGKWNFLFIRKIANGWEFGPIGSDALFGRGGVVNCDEVFFAKTMGDVAYMVDELRRGRPASQLNDAVLREASFKKGV